MKNVIKFGSVLLAMGLLASCGEDKEETFTGTIGSCSYSITVASTTVSSCGNFSYSFKGTEDPKSTLQSTQEVACTTLEGTWSATEPCATEGSVGTCTSSSDAGGGSTITTETVYGSGFTSDTARSSCEEDGGTFTAS